MFDLTEASALRYLALHGFELPSARVESLGGGVSNTVLLVRPAGSAEPIVLKQSLERLRVAEEWLADRDRIVREYRAIELVAKLLPSGSVPRVVLADPANCLYAMSAARVGSRPWKELLFAGRESEGIARTVARMLAWMVAGSWHSQELQAEFGDKRVFDQLRLDAYYRFAASRNADLAPRILGLVERTLQSNLSLVHGDWSPKNLLVAPDDSVMAIDFEVVHFGDPGFDLAFLVNHLFLKSVHMPGSTHCLAAARAFWSAFAETAPDVAGELEPRLIDHLGVLMLARVDGKSPAEYLRDSEKTFVRQVARAWIAEPPPDMGALFDAWQERIGGA